MKKQDLARLPLQIAIALSPMTERVAISTCHKPGLFNVLVRDLSSTELAALYKLGMAIRQDRTSVFWCSGWVDCPPGNRDPIAHHRGEYDGPNRGGERRGIRPT